MASNLCLLHSSLFGTSAQNSVILSHMLPLESTWQVSASFISRTTSQTQPMTCLCSTTYAMAYIDAQEKSWDNPLPSLYSVQSLSQDSSLHPHDKQLYWAAFTLAFYGFLWASEYTSPTHGLHDQSRHLLCQDNSMKIHIKASNTDQYQSAVGLSAKLAPPPALSMPQGNFWNKAAAITPHPSLFFEMGNTLQGEMYHQWPNHSCA